MRDIFKVCAKKGEDIEEIEVEFGEREIRITWSDRERRRRGDERDKKKREKYKNGERYRRNYKIETENKMLLIVKASERNARIKAKLKLSYLNEYHF